MLPLRMRCRSASFWRSSWRARSMSISCLACMSTPPSRSVMPQSRRVPARTTSYGGPAAVARAMKLHTADLRVLVRQLALAQHELLGLAGRGLRQRPELHRIRALVVREASAAERYDFIRGCRGALIEGD